MPSKAAQLIAFFAVLLISALLHRYVYVNLRRLLLRDYPKLGPRFVSIARILFIVMDSPFLFLYIRSHIHAELATLTRVLLYPFSIWQAVMLMWAIVLLPFSLWRHRDWLVIPWIAERFRRLTFRSHLKDGSLTESEGFQPELEIASDSM